MNQKELNEIRRRIKLDRSNIRHIYGCYVGADRSIISFTDESVGLLSESESELYLGLLRKTLSGALGRNLIDISFAAKQVMEGEEHRLLSALRRTELQDEALRQDFFRAIAASLDMEDRSYLILLAFDAYDVPHRGKDEQSLGSDNVFKYILCSVCPIKEGKAGLGYDADEKRFRTAAVDHVVGNPELGFMFPAFDDRAANIYDALMYSHDTSELHRDFIDAVFKTEAPMSAGHQREAFNAALTQSLEKELSYDVLQSVHEQLSQRIEEHKESRDPETLEVTVEELSDMLETSGVSAETVESFKASCREQFGDTAAVPPANIIDTKHIRLETPEVSITVDPRFSYLVQTKVINGRKCIVIAADKGVEVNGVAVNIEE